MMMLRNFSIKGLLPSFRLSGPAAAVAKTRRLSSGTAAESMKPVIFLDIDGVINMRDCFGRTDFSAWRDAVVNEVKITDPPCDEVKATLRIVYSPTVVKKLNEWSKIAEIYWLTSWGERANTHLAPAIGLEGPFSTLPHGVRIPNCKGKFLCATDFAAKLNPNRLIIWLEDDLVRLQKRVESLGHLSPDHEDYPEVELGESIHFRPNSLYVAPSYGLTRHQLELVDSYLADPALAKGKMIYDFDDRNEESTILVDKDLVRKYKGFEVVHSSNVWK